MSVAADQNSYQIIHRHTGAQIRVHADVIDLIDEFYKARMPSELDAVYPLNDLNQTIAQLIKIKFLIDENADEDTPILNRWRQTELCYRSDKEQLINIGPFSISCYEKDFRKVCKMARITTPGYQQICREIFPFPRKILVCLLEKEEYEEIARRYNLPDRTIAFVDAKTILIIKASGLNRWMQQGYRYHVSMKHELIHVLVGQYHYYLPNWLEEGICEFYSKQSNPIRLVQQLRCKKLISFDEIEKSIEFSLMDLDDAPIAHNVLYMQAHSFIRHLVDSVGPTQFWKVAALTGIRKDFGKTLQRLFGADLKRIEDIWRENIEGKPKCCNIGENAANGQ